MTVEIATAQAIAQSVLVSSLLDKQESAIGKLETAKARVTLVKPASGDGGVSA